MVERNGLPMTGGWETKPLGDVVTLQRGYDLPSQERQPGTVPIVSSSGVSGLHSEAKTKAPGVVTGRYGTIGEVHYVQEDFWPLNTTLFVKDFKGNNERFIYYLLTSLDFTIFSDKSSVPGVNRNHLHEMLVQVPNKVEEQRRIAHVLGTLDDKIELNRRMSQTLEEIARALFKSWFVDFDPVHAKAAGREPVGMDAETAALFPSEFEESELGLIPKGWKVLRIKDISEVTIGGVWGEDKPSLGSTETIVLRGVDLELLRKTGWAYAPRRWMSKQAIEKRQLAETDVLVAASGAGPTGRPLWASNMVNYLWNAPVTYSNFCKRLRCKTRELAIFLDQHLNIMRGSGEIWDYVNGTSVPNLDLAGLMIGKGIVVPDEQILKVYAQLNDLTTQSLYSLEQRTLATIRDALLPKLLSGQLRLDLDQEIRSVD